MPSPPDSPSTFPRLVGRAVERVEDAALLTGRGRFADDVGERPGTAHVAVLRSPHAHAEIVSLDAAAALSMPEVVTVLIGAEVAAWSRPFIAGVKQPMRHYALAVDRVRYTGEPVAVVVARDRYSAEDALERIEVEYRELDPVVDPVAAAAPGAPLLHRAVGSNVVSDRRFRYGDPDAAFASAAHLAAMKLRERLARIASVGQESRVKVVRSGQSGSAHWAARATRVAPARFAWILCLAALVSLGSLWHARADHGADHREVAPIGAAGEAASPAPEGLAKTAPALAKLLGLGDGIQIGASGEDEFLDPEVAFVLSAVAAGPDAIETRWHIAEGYYLYRKKFRFKAADGSGASLGEAGFPTGMIRDDEYFGPMEVYYGSVAALVPVARAAPAAAGSAIDVDITYQGCADAGLCYPPITKTVSLLLPAALADTGAGAAPGGGVSSLLDPEGRGAIPELSKLQAPSAGGVAPGAPVPPDLAAAGVVPSMPGLPGVGATDAEPIELPEQDRVASALMSGNRWLVILSLFGAGLLLTFTPCVLPMVPILTSIIVGQGTDPHSGVTSSRRAFMLSLVYVLAMAFTYTVAGVLAGLFGANLAAAFQDPWIVSAFALVFVLLALSMFGFYDLQIPTSWQARLAALSHRQRGGTYAGVGVMGTLSALIVGPCVAAPLAGVLIYIGRTGDPVLGGIALFALGMGMGVPLIVAGVSAGKLLPKVGAWMNAVKAVFGVMLLAVAIYLLERVVPEPVALLLWAALFIVCAIYMGALDSLTAESGGWRRLWKGAGLVMLVYGVLVMVGVAGGGGDLFRPLKGIGLLAGEGAERELEFRQVKGIDGLNAELRPAAARGQVVMFDYYADWCVSCKEMERFTFSDPAVQTALSNVLLLQTDVTANDALDKALVAEFGLFGPPAILFFGPDGRERRELRVVGFMNAGEFRRVVERAVSPADAIRASRMDAQWKS